MGESCETKYLPQHVAIIMDGNGRWAQKRMLPREAGHRQGALTAQEIVRHAHDIGIKYITLYAFSNENWQRSPQEVRSVMSILQSYLEKDPNQLVKNNIKIKAIGELTRLPKNLQKPLLNIIEKSRVCTGLTITLALSYGSWGEIVDTCKSVAEQVQNKSLTLEQISAEVFKKHLYTCDLPDPELFIRTSGEIRLSNFLLMQLSYCELYFTKKLWPDFQKSDFDDALTNFRNRYRRYGK